MPIPKDKNKRPQFEWQPFSEKQLKIMTWWMPQSPYCNWDGIIADGAVRSGKTVSMSASFVIWAMHYFTETDFALCGKTVGSLRRNVVNHLKMQLASMGCDYEEKRTANLLTVTKDGRTNYFYMFGGKDESSQDLIQGMTLGGILFDEVALMPQSFVAQGEARCSLEGAKMWYNCNPKSPTHYFKTDYIDQAGKTKNLLYLHFTMDDNLTLSEAVKERYRRQFTGVFYDRNILGLWVTAEGKIYKSFGKDNIISKTDWYAKDDNGNWLDARRRAGMIATVGVDFGGNKSATAFVCSLFTRNLKEIITVKDMRITEEMTPAELEAKFCDFIRACRAEYNVNDVYCDSAEQVLIRGLKNAVRNEKIPVAIHNARKGEIIDRIRFYASMQDQLRHLIVSDCTDTIQAFTDAVWDEKHEDVRLDDGSTNIDSLDAQEYSSEWAMKNMIDLKGVV